MDNRNKFRYRFMHKETKKTSYFDTWCYGNIDNQIFNYLNDLSKMCLVGVSNDTHELIEVIWLHTNKTIWRNNNV